MEQDNLMYQDMITHLQSLDKEIEDLEDLIIEKEKRNYSSYEEEASNIIINGQDFNRYSSADRKYLKKYKSLILGIFNNSCAVCGDTKGIELDHHFLCKRDGGSFQLVTINGKLLNNAIPLCERCNRSKGARPYTIFEKDVIDRINYLNNIITNKIVEEIEKENQEDDI